MGSSTADLQLLVFDTRRGNQEGREEDKLLAFFPPGAPPMHQSGVAGLLQGLLLFTATFTATPVSAWGVPGTANTSSWRRMSCRHTRPAPG